MMCDYITYLKSILMILTELDLTNESQPMMKNDSPPHLTSPHRGEGIFSLSLQREAPGMGGLQCEDR
jgi:hypothetical protein